MAVPNKLDYITKDNVLLYEKHDVESNEVIKQGDNKVFMVKGARIFRVVRPKKDGGFRVLTQYDANTDSIDLTKLNYYKGWFMASVDLDEYNKTDFVWNCIRIGEGTEDNKVFQALNPRRCTEEEVEILNEVFPEYFDHAYSFIK